MTTVAIRTSAWYGDRQLALQFPAEWEVSAPRPNTPRPLSDEQIAARLRGPVGQPPISEFARGMRNPVVILDDLTRPTPADRVVPFVLGELEKAGVPAARVTFVVASGTHGPATINALAKKAGAEAARACRIVGHDDRAGDLVNVGRTSFGTPVLVNKTVAASDYVIGIGGVYPQHSTGFGGGAKLAIGVLGRRSITHLHYGHPSMNGGLDTNNDFRRDLGEVARMIGLRTSISAHVDANREIVRLVSGSHDDYYDDAVAFSLSAYTAPPPGTADVVISNAYPMDVSLTFMRSKGILPLLKAAPAASRVVVAACPEGVGHHGLFPFVNLPRFERARQVTRRVVVRPRVLPELAANVLTRAVVRKRAAPEQTRSRIHLYVPEPSTTTLPNAIPGMAPVYSWDEVLDRVTREQGGRSRLQALIYPCAPLQIVGS